MAEGFEIEVPEVGLLELRRSAGRKHYVRSWGGADVLVATCSGLLLDRLLDAYNTVFGTPAEVRARTARAATPAKARVPSATPQDRFFDMLLGPLTDSEQQVSPRAALRHWAVFRPRRGGGWILYPSTLRTTRRAAISAFEADGLRFAAERRVRGVRAMRCTAPEVPGV